MESCEHRFTSEEYCSVCGKEESECLAIKPCPFCGGEALMNTLSNVYETVWSISCVGEEDSDCTGLNGSGFRDDKRELIRQWNKRIL